MDLLADNKEMNSVLTAWVRLFERINAMRDPQRLYVLQNIDASLNVLKHFEDEGAGNA